MIGLSVTTPDLIHAFGFSGHGFQLGPVVGEIIAELIIGRALVVAARALRDQPVRGHGEAPPASAGVEHWITMRFD